LIVCSAVAFTALALQILSAGALLSAAQAPVGRLWVDVTPDAIGTTGFWTNKVEIADIDGDGRPDLLFANGGDYSTPGTPEPNQVFLNTGPGFRFTDATERVFGPTPDLARVIKARDLDNDGLVDIIVGTTYQTESHQPAGPAPQRRRSGAG
jgi:FG-GAP-like repeat